MKLQLTIENLNMPQKAERSSKPTCKCCRTKRWQLATLAFYATLLHVTIAVTTSATTLTSVTGSGLLNQSNNKVLLRYLRVANKGDAMILCKTTDHSNTHFYNELGEKVSHILHHKDELLKPYVVLFLRGITKNSKYICKEGDKVISDTKIRIAHNVSTPVRVEISKGDDAVLIAQHNVGEKLISKPKPSAGGSEKIDIIEFDNSTSLLLIRNASEQNNMFTFQYTDGNSTESYFYVGHTPEPVTNFTCRGENYDYMVCEFAPPPNNLSVEYRISYIAESSHPNACQMNFEEGRMFLTLTLDGNCRYYPRIEKYNFTLRGANSLGSFTQNFLINNHEHVVPGKLKIEVINKTDRSAHLSWDNEKGFFYDGVTFRIIVTPKDFKSYTIFLNSTHLNYNYVLENLKYANWTHTVSISARVNKNKIWNEPTVVNFETEPRRPDRAPRTFPGSFYGHENNITLYWEELVPSERNGENFTYVIQDLSANTSLEDSLKTTEPAINFRWSNQTKIYKYKIFAKNAVGMSQTGNTIEVKSVKFADDPLKYIEKLQLKDRSFKLLWKYWPIPSNYTVFWCRALDQRATKCEGAMHFKVISSNTTQHIIESKEQITIAGVAANYPSGSTGLHWQTCYSDLYDTFEVIKLDVEAKTAKEISLRWYDEICVNALDTYHITYCELRDEMNLNCHRKREQKKNITLSDLKEYTYYNITIQALGKNHQERHRSKSITCQTKEAAPEPPKNVNFVKDSITSTSVNISWVAPMVTNGVLRKYTIWYKLANEIMYKEKTISARSGLSSIIEGLNSGSTYEIYVTASTTEQSTASESIRIKTMIGIPSSPAKTTLKQHGDFYIFNWTLPDMRAGHVDLYELILIENEKKKILTVKRISDGPQICRFKFPACTDGTQSMEVRAINLVTKQQLDRNRFRIAETEDEGKWVRERRNSDPAYPTSQVHTQVTTNANDKRNLNDTMPKESTTTTAAKKQKQRITVHPYKHHKDFECEELSSSLSLVVPNVTHEEYYMLTSESEQNSNQLLCAQVPWQHMVAIIILFIMAIISIIWSYNKINKKRNIKVELPESILELMRMSIKLPTEMEVNKADNISIVSTKTNDSKSLINTDSHHHIQYQHSSTSSSGESGVAGIDGDNSVSPSTSSDDVNGEYARNWSQDVPTSPQTTTTLNSLSQSSPAHQRTPALPCGNGGIKINDDYLRLEQITNKRLLPNVDDRSISSGSTYLLLHSIKSKSSSSSESGTFDYTVGSTKDNANTAILKNHTKPVLIQAKSSPTHPNIIRNLPIKTGDYVPPDSLMRLSTSHNAYMSEDNNRTHDTLESVQSNFLKTGNYVSPDAFSRMTASHKPSMNEVESKPEKTFQKQFLPSKSTGVAQPNLTNTNPMLARDSHVLPDSLSEIGASFSTENENQKSQGIFPKQPLNGKTTHIQTNHFGNVKPATGRYVSVDALPKIAASFALKEENEKSQNVLDKQQLNGNGRPNLCENLKFSTGDHHVSVDALPKNARTHGAASAAAAAAAATATDRENSEKPLQQLQQQTKSPIVSYGYVTPDFWVQQQQSAMK